MKSYSENILKMAAEHHEKYDVTGYPFQLKGEKNFSVRKSLRHHGCFWSLDLTSRKSTQHDSFFRPD